MRCIIGITNLVYETFEALQRFNKSGLKNKSLNFTLEILYYFIML